LSKLIYLEGFNLFLYQAVNDLQMMYGPQVIISRWNLGSPSGLWSTGDDIDKLRLCSISDRFPTSAEELYYFHVPPVVNDSLMMQEW